MIYLDHHATTPVDPRVLETMLPFFTERFGNAASKQHRFGWDANDAVERARKQVAALIGAGSKDVIFTSGATEANNLAIKGAAEARRADGDHLVTVVTEHKAVLDPLKRLERDGWRVTVLPVKSSGLVDLAALEAATTDADGARERDGGEQRDRRAAADQGSRGDCAREGRVVPHRRGAGGRQGAVRRRRAGRRPGVDDGPQDLRAEGRRRVVCARGTGQRRCRSPRRSTAAATSAACGRAR